MLDIVVEIILLNTQTSIIQVLRIFKCFTLFH